MERLALFVLVIGAIYLLISSREHLEARYFACSQVCDFAHPGLMNTCSEKGGVEKTLSGVVTVESKECQAYYDCVNSCREEQRQEIANDPTFNSGSRYAHLDEW